MRSGGSRLVAWFLAGSTNSKVPCTLVRCLFQHEMDGSKQPRVFAGSFAPTRISFCLPTALILSLSKQ